MGMGGTLRLDQSMLRTLERGIEGGKWFALIDRVYRKENLRSAYYQVWRNAGSAGIDGQSVEQFEAREEKHLQQLSQELQNRSYRPAAVKRVWIPKRAAPRNDRWEYRW